MAFSPIAYIAPNYREYQGWWLKAYVPSTTTPKLISVDASGTTTVAKLQLNSNGFIVSAGGAVVMPYLENSYDAYLFPTEFAADNNDTSDAVRVADNIITPIDSFFVLYYDNVSELTSQSLTQGQRARLDRYYNQGELVEGLNYYIKTASQAATDGDVVNEFINFTLDNGNIAVLIKGTSLHIKQAGAVLDGVTDDTLAVRAWWNSSNNLVGEKGTALLTSWEKVNVVSDRNVQGNGLTLKGVSSADFTNLNAKLTIKGVTFDTWSNVIIKGSGDTTESQLIVEGCAFTNIALYGISLLNNISNTRISGNTFKDNSTGAILIGGNTPAIQATCRDIIVNDNFCTDITNTGAGNCHFILALCENITVQGNIIKDISANTGEAWGIYTKSLQAIISSNIIENIISTSSNSFGVNMKGENRGADTTAEADRVICTDNVIINSTTGLAGINVNQEKVSVSRNTIEGFTNGVLLSGTHDNYNVENNIIIGLGAGNTACYGIRTTMAGDNYKIKNNTISEVYNGVRVGSSADCLNLDISENSVTSFGIAAFYISPSAGIVSDVKINDNTAIDGERFILSTNTDRLSIKDNNWGGLTASPFQYITFESGSTNTNVSISGNTPIRVTTTTATSTPVVLLVMPNDEVASIKVGIVGISSTNRAMYNKQGLIYVTGGTAAQQGSTQDITADIESNAAWSSAITANGASARSDVVGAAGEAINWAIDLTYSSVSI